MRALRTVWQGWKRLAKRIGDFQARVLLGVFYFALVGPFAIGMRLGSDPLAIKKGSQKGWRELARVEGTSIESAQRQF
jgi:hypothetical protein